MVEMAWKQVPEGQSKVENGFQNKLLSVKFTSTLTSVMTTIQYITEMGCDWWTVFCSNRLSIVYLFNLIGPEQKQFIKSVLYELYNAQANFTAEQNEISYSLRKSSINQHNLFANFWPNQLSLKRRDFSFKSSKQPQWIGQHFASSAWFFESNRTGKSYKLMWNEKIKIKVILK